MTHRLVRSVLLLVALFAASASAAQRPGMGEGVSEEKLFEALALREGMTACEVGAGSGSLSLAAARLVGPTGRVYTNELGARGVKRLEDAVERSGLTHVTVVSGAATSTNFPDAACDGLFLRDVYHHFTDPAAMNASMLAALKPGARLAVIDFTPPGDEASRPDERGGSGAHGVKPETVARELKEAGFQAISIEDPPQRWFLVLAQKPPAP